MKHGLAAGPIRNKEMINYLLDSEEPGILIAIPTEDSRGTTNIMEQAKKMGLSAYVHLYEQR
jgi:hypothetical protein